MIAVAAAALSIMMFLLADVTALAVAVAARRYFPHHKFIASAAPPHRAVLQTGVMQAPRPLC